MATTIHFVSGESLTVEDDIATAQKKLTDAGGGERVPFESLDGEAALVAPDHVTHLTGDAG